jgi:hypothetical protein
MEAMASGCIPIVRPNFAEQIEDFGYVCKTPQENARVSYNLLGDKEKVLSLCLGASEYAQRHYSGTRFRKHVMTELVNIYKK